MAYDLQIAAATVWMEARGEGPDGEFAVACVLVNRLKSKRYGVTLADVCLDPYQFSSWNTQDPNRRHMAWAKDEDLAACEDAVRRALADPSSDITGGATLYYSTTMKVPPHWASSPHVHFTKQIGRQRYFTET